MRLAALATYHACARKDQRREVWRKDVRWVFCASEQDKTLRELFHLSIKCRLLLAVCSSYWCVNQPLLWPLADHHKQHTGLVECLHLQGSLRNFSQNQSPQGHLEFWTKPGLDGLIEPWYLDWWPGWSFVDDPMFLVVSIIFCVSFHSWPIQCSRVDPNCHQKICKKCPSVMLFSDTMWMQSLFCCSCRHKMMKGSLPDNFTE